jgi:hypothetical protein
MMNLMRRGTCSERWERLGKSPTLSKIARKATSKRLTTHMRRSQATLFTGIVGYTMMPQRASLLPTCDSYVPVRCVGFHRLAEDRSLEACCTVMNTSKTLQTLCYECDISITRVRVSHKHQACQVGLLATSSGYPGAARILTDTAVGNQHNMSRVCRYEGLTRDAVPHGKGTMTFGKQGKGAGIPNTKPGDRYEGEFHGGFAHGVGMFTDADGSVFKGEFSAGLRDGCGSEYDLGPWRRRMKDGMEPAKAWREAKEEVQESIRMGTWNNDVFTTGPTDLGTGCSIGEIKRTMYETDSLVARARMFQFKPGGDVRS